MPLAPALLQREIEAAIVAGYCSDIGFDLRYIALALLIEKCLDSSALVLTRLVVDDPLLALCILDVAIDSETTLTIAQPVFVARQRMGAEKPAAALVSVVSESIAT